MENSVKLSATEIFSKIIRTDETELGYRNMPLNGHKMIWKRKKQHFNIFLKCSCWMPLIKVIGVKTSSVAYSYDILNT